MAKIHWSVYIIVGLFVSIFSWRVNYDKFVFFFYAGWIFVFIGIAKLAFGFANKKMNRTKEPEVAPQHKAPLQPQQQAHHYRRCRKCGNVIGLHDRFCNRCGSGV